MKQKKKTDYQKRKKNDTHTQTRTENFLNTVKINAKNKNK